MDHGAPTGTSPWYPDEFSLQVMGLLQKFPMTPAYGHTEMVALVEAPDNCCLCQTLYRGPWPPWTPDYSHSWGPLVVQNVHAVLPVRGLLGPLCSGHPSPLIRILPQHSWGLEKNVNTCILPAYPISLPNASISSVCGNGSCQSQGQRCYVVKAFQLVLLSSHLAIPRLH